MANLPFLSTTFTTGYMGTKMSTPNFPVSTLQAALAASVANGTFSDTAYYLYSRRGTNGKAHSPHPVFASSTVMKACSEYFAKQLDNPPPVDTKIPEESDDYDYDTDSDLDEDEVLDDIEDGMSDMSSVRSVSSCATEQPDQSEAKDEGSESFNIVRAPTAAPPACAGSDSVARAKHKIFIPNVAATTWKALIYYVYTGDVFFAPVRSSGGEARQLAKSEERADGPAFCSPKSMYRLAGLVGLSDLKNLAKQAIEGGFSEDCIADEIFSKFSSYHPEILQMQLAYLYDGGRLARVMPKIKARVKAAIRGGMTHVEVVLDSLLDKLSEKMLSATTFPIAPRTKQPTGPASTKSPPEVTPSSPSPSSTVTPAVAAAECPDTLPRAQPSSEIAAPSPGPTIPEPSEPSLKESQNTIAKSESGTTSTDSAAATSETSSATNISPPECPLEQPTKQDSDPTPPTPPNSPTVSAPAQPADVRKPKRRLGHGNSPYEPSARRGPATDASSTAKTAATAGATDQRVPAAQRLGRIVCQHKSGTCSCSICLRGKEKQATDQAGVQAGVQVGEVLRSLLVNVWDTPS